jgi:hypothetical protein
MTNHLSAPSRATANQAGVYAVTLGRAQRRATPLGVVDLLYLGAGHSKGLSALPEVELPKGFRVSVARAMLRRTPV